MPDDRVFDPWRLFLRKRLTLEDCDVLLQYKHRYRTATWFVIDLVFVRLYAGAQDKKETAAISRFHNRLYS